MNSLGRFPFVRNLLLTSVGVCISSMATADEKTDSRLDQFVDYFQNNLMGMVFVGEERDRPYKDQIVDYEYDLSFHDLLLSAHDALSFQLTYNIKRSYYMMDESGQKTGVPEVRRNTQVTSCSLRLMQRTTQDLLGICQVSSDNRADITFLGLAKRLKIEHLDEKKLAWTSSTVGYIEGFNIYQQGYAPQFEIQSFVFESLPANGQERNIQLTRTTTTYSYDTDRDSVGPQIAETAALIKGQKL